MRTPFFVIPLIMIVTLVSGQITVDDDATGYYDYALDFSTNDLIGSSRMLGLGGAQNALGADISTQGINPAGLGVYRKSDWGMSISSDQSNAVSKLTTSIDNTSTRLSNGNTNLPALGFIFTSKEDNPDDGPWKSQAFGISLTRMNSFNQSFSYKGRNRDFSLRNYLVETAKGTNWTAFDNQLDENGFIENIFGGAYYAFLLNTVDDAGTSTEQSTYFTIDGDKEDNIEENITRSGRTLQWNAGYGANYEDKLYIGANLGIISLRRENNRNYTESLVNENDLTSFTYEEVETTRGFGVNFSVGLIYRPTNSLRLGFTYKSRTTVTLREEFQARVIGRFNDLQVQGSSFVLTEEEYSTPNYLFSYQLTMPAKYTLGGAYFFHKKAFVSTDIDIVSTLSPDVVKFRF